MRKEYRKISPDIIPLREKLQFDNGSSHFLRIGKHLPLEMSKKNTKKSQYGSQQNSVVVGFFGRTGSDASDAMLASHERISLTE